MMVVIAPAPTPEALAQVAAQVAIDEPIDLEADLAVMAYTADARLEPVGFVAGRRVTMPDGREAALFEHVLVRPEWESRGVALQLATAWELYVIARGLAVILAAIPKALDREEIIRLALAWGFRPYEETETHRWYVRYLPVTGAAERPTSALGTPAPASADASRPLV